MRISDWSSDVCSSDLVGERRVAADLGHFDRAQDRPQRRFGAPGDIRMPEILAPARIGPVRDMQNLAVRSEEHTSELQSLMRISYAVFCLKKKKNKTLKSKKTNTIVINTTNSHTL